MVNTGQTILSKERASIIWQHKVVKSDNVRQIGSDRNSPVYSFPAQQCVWADKGSQIPIAHIAYSIFIILHRSTCY